MRSSSARTAPKTGTACRDRTAALGRVARIGGALMPEHEAGERTAASRGRRGLTHPRLGGRLDHDHLAARASLAANRRRGAGAALVKVTAAVVYRATRPRAARLEERLRTASRLVNNSSATSACVGMVGATASALCAGTSCSASATCSSAWFSSASARVNGLPSGGNPNRCRSTAASASCRSAACHSSCVIRAWSRAIFVSCRGFVLVFGRDFERGGSGLVIDLVDAATRGE